MSAYTRLLETPEAVPVDEIKRPVAELEALAEIAKDAAAEPPVSLTELAFGLRELADLIDNDYLPARGMETAYLNIGWFAKNPEAVQAFAASRGGQSNQFEHGGVVTTTAFAQLGGVFLHVSNREAVTR